MRVFTFVSSISWQSTLIAQKLEQNDFVIEKKLVFFLNFGNLFYERYF